jgi:hypothetical protein
MKHSNELWVLADNIQGIQIEQYVYSKRCLKDYGTGASVITDDSSNFQLLIKMGVCALTLGTLILLIS